MAHENKTKEKRIRGRILEAASSALLEYGPTHVKIKDISKKAGISTSLVYYYFPDKQSLLKEAVLTVDKKFLAKLREEVYKVDDPLMRLKRYLTVRFELLHDAPGRRKMSIDETIRYMPVFLSAFDVFINDEAELIKEILEQCVASSACTIDDVDAWANQLARLAIAVDHMSFTIGEHILDINGVWNHIVDVFFKGLTCKKESQQQF